MKGTFALGQAGAATMAFIKAVHQRKLDRALADKRRGFRNPDTREHTARIGKEVIYSNLAS